MKEKKEKGEGKERSLGLIKFALTVFGVISPFIIFIKRKLSISLVNEIPVVDTRSIDSFLNTRESGHDTIEDIIFSMELYKTKVSMLSFEIKNKGREAATIEEKNYIKMVFEHAEILRQPILKSSQPKDYLKNDIVTYQDTVILPLSIINPDETYYMDILLLTNGSKDTDIKVSGTVTNQKK